MMITSDKYEEWLLWLARQGDYTIRVPGNLFAAVLNQCDCIVMHSGGITPAVFYEFRQHLHDALTEKKIEKAKADEQNTGTVQRR